MPIRNHTVIEGQVTHYPYRTAMVRNAQITGPISQYADLWQELADTAGVRPGNHEVFAITDSSGKVVYIMFTDEFARIGTEIIEGSW